MEAPSGTLEAFTITRNGSMSSLISLYDTPSIEGSQGVQVHSDLHIAAQELCGAYCVLDWRADEGCICVCVAPEDKVCICHGGGKHGGRKDGVGRHTSGCGGSWVQPPQPTLPCGRPILTSYGYTTSYAA